MIADQLAFNGGNYTSTIHNAPHSILLPACQHGEGLQLVPFVSTGICHFLQRRMPNGYSAALSMHCGAMGCYTSNTHSPWQHLTVLNSACAQQR